MKPLKLFRCPICGKRMRAPESVVQHARDRHHRLGVTPVPVQPRQERDHETMADLFVQAEINRHMGVPNEEWIEEMLP